MNDDITATTPSTRTLPRRAKPPGVTAIADALEGRVDDMVDETLHIIVDEVPVYRLRGDEVTADTKRAAAYVYSSFLATLRTGSPPNEAVARSLANVGADRAAQGIPLGDLLQAFRISARTLTSVLSDVVEAGDHLRDAAMWVGEAMVLWLDVISNLAAHDYTREQARILHETEERRRSVLLDVLYGGISGEAARERAEEAGWDPATDYTVAVVGRADTKGVSRDVENRFSSTLARSFVTRIRGDVVILKPSPSDEIRTTLTRTTIELATEVGLCVGLTSPRQGVAGVRRAYLEAAEALSIARASGDTVVHYDDAILDRLLRREPALLAELADRTIAPLVEYDRARNTDLLLTLETWFEEGESPTRAAEAMHTHPQTIRYRLNRINAITDLRLEDPNGRLHLLLGMRARKLLPHLRRSEDAGDEL